MWTIKEQTGIHFSSGENSPQERDPSRSEEDELQDGVGSKLLEGLDAVARYSSRFLR